MRKTYMKPVAEIEVYKLDAAIALNCQDKVTLGPEAIGHDACEGFGDDWEVVTFSARSTGTTPFYDDGSLTTCDCYYSSRSDNGLFTS